MINSNFAFGRPIGKSSFAIIKSTESLGFDKVFIGRGSDINNNESMAYLSGLTSSTIFPNLSPYGASTIHLKPDADEDYLDLTKRKYRIFSSYRSGSIVEITKQINLYGAGVLTDKDWQPITLATGTLYNVDTKAGLRFFTNEEGYFEIEKLEPGKYKFILDSGEESATVVVKNDVQSRMFDFGILNIAELR